MTTIQDVARRAGVAPITVSRVVNKSGYASEETRNRVESAIKELGYVPNTLARGLRSKRTNTLALVMTDITNPFFTMIARGVEDVASAAGLTVIFCNTDESKEKEKKYIEILTQKQIDGIVLIPACGSPDSIEFLRAKEIPVVLLDRRVPDIEIDLVRCDSTAGAYQLIKRLIELGHKDIAAITGPEGVSTSDDRVTGYRQALYEVGLKSHERIYYGSFTQDSGYSLAIQALKAQPRPTALFGANNLISIGILKSLRDADVRVPEDISVVGFDDLPISMVVDPILTVLSQPAYQMGEQAAALLLSRLRGEHSVNHQEIILPTRIIERNSISAPAIH